MAEPDSITAEPENAMAEPKSIMTGPDSVVVEPESVMAEPKKKNIGLAGLTPEILGMIIDQVARPSDLKNVCLVNKFFHEIAVKTLYYDIALDVGSANDKRLTAFLNPENIGLKHIRKIRLDLARVHDRGNHDQQAHLMCQMLLTFLPRDILEEFRCGDPVCGDGEYGPRSLRARSTKTANDRVHSWCPWQPFSADNLMLLYRRQRKIKYLEAMDVDTDILADIKQDEKLQENMFKEVRKLALYPENRATLDLAGFFMSKMKNAVEHLTLHANFSDVTERRSRSPPADSIEDQELNDSATGPGLLTSTIFASLMPFDKCEPLEHLTVVKLHQISVRFCQDTWCKIINFTQCKELSIHGCTGADTLLSQLCKANNLPKNLAVFELSHKDNFENEALLALDGFLCLVSGIKELIIDLDNVKALPTAEGIARHHKTLQILCVHASRARTRRDPLATNPDDEGDQLVWSTASFTNICDACTSLEQISCAWPATSLIRAPSTDWISFLHACKDLRSLVTLHTTTWPSNKPSASLLPRMVYQELLRSLAETMFSWIYGKAHYCQNLGAILEVDTSPQGKLRLVAFGVNEKAFDRQDSQNQIIYLRSTCVNAVGLTKPYATEISWCHRRFLEGRSDVLDYTLMPDRSIRPPYRENDVRGAHSWGRTGDDDDDE